MLGFQVVLRNMRVATNLTMLYICIFLEFLQASAASQNFVVPWSNQRFGPDGPWQAVNIQVGGYTTDRLLGVQNVSTLSVYPGGSYQSMTFTASACENFSSSTCGAGGFWEPDLLHGNQTRIGWPASWIDDTYGIQVEYAQSIVLGLTINGTTVWNATLASASSGNITYPDGRVGPVTLGHLSLGGKTISQIFTLGPEAQQEAPTFPGELFESNSIPSYSYSLHIGSTMFNYPGSLVFGGYNKGRAIGPITYFANESAVSLLDISIGVASGNSPFSFTNKDKLLSTGRTIASPDLLSPYIALPRQTCENLANVLPVVFDEILGYYLWNTSDPNFEMVVISAAYLGFSFAPNSDSDEAVVIKVPFALLNLTLDTPITNTPVQYFPCTPYDTSTPVLGRAFLQAAFIGRNWETQTSWIAQAPGPGMRQGRPGQERRQGLGEENLDIPKEAIEIEGYTGSEWFTKSWEGQWSLEESLRGSGMTNPQPSSNGTYPTGVGLSVGIKAGIGVGVAFGVIALVAALFSVRKVLAKKRASSTHHQREKLTESHRIYEASNSNEPMAELSQGPKYLAAELPHPQQYSELPRFQQDPVELGDTAVRNS
jgi:hypothetical protein